MRVGLLSLVDDHPGKQTQTDRYRQVVWQAVLAEELGFDTFWIGEHHFMDYVCPSPALLLSAVAANTSRIRLGTGVALPAHHDPVRMAEDYAMLDVLSNGRFDLVISRGTFKAGFVGFNQDMEERTERTAEAIEIIRGCWTNERFDYKGTFRTCDELYVQPRPVQQPHPPIWLGCNSEASARFAADVGLHLALADVLGPLLDIPAIVAAYREQLVANGEDPEKYQVSVGKHAYVAETAGRAHDEYLPHYRNYMEMMRREAERTASRAEDDPIVAAMAMAADLPDETLLANALCTDAEGILAKMSAVQEDIGVDHYWFQLDIGAQTDEQIERSMRYLAEEVLPKVQS